MFESNSYFYGKLVKSSSAWLRAGISNSKRLTRLEKGQLFFCVGHSFLTFFLYLKKISSLLLPRTEYSFTRIGLGCFRLPAEPALCADLGLQLG